MNANTKMFFIILFFSFLIQNSFSQEPFSVQINSQIWSTNNLDVETFQNGDTILHAPSFEEWLTASEEGVPVWCYYNNDPELGKEIGRMYNWYAASDERGLAPEGWRVPVTADVKKLVSFVGFDFWTTFKLASKDWKGPEADIYGFNAKPGGVRFVKLHFPVLHNDTTIYNPVTKFASLGSGVGYWLADTFQFDEMNGSVFLLNIQEEAEVYGDFKENGYYIRCIKE